MWWTADRQRYAVDYLMSNGGLSLYGAVGLVSRWANVEAPAGPGSRGGYLGRAWGIAQWLGPRLPPIDGNSNFDDQLAYVVQELNGTEYVAARALRAAADVMSGAVAATMYERAGNYHASTGTDDYTNKTAAGIPSVLALIQGLAPVPSTDTTDDSLVDLGSWVSDYGVASIAGVFLLGLGLILFLGDD